MSEPFRIGVAGLGTVGCGVLRLLAENRDLIAARAGRRVDVVAVSARDRSKERDADLSGVEWVQDPVALATLPGLDAVVELIGGDQGPALTLAEAALEQGLAFVTANKALIAARGGALAELAGTKGASIACEAAVAGGIPVLKAIREGLAANRVSRIQGILNGTSNFILTQMEETGRDFTEVLKEAQELGYAEADPSFDIGGVDAAHKLVILVALAFGSLPSMDGVHVEGIEAITAADIAEARALGFRIKLLGLAERRHEGVLARVCPCLVPIDTPIAHIGGVTNAVAVEADPVGRTVFEGPGAGAGPTASAVVADLVDLARGLRAPLFGIPAAALSPASPLPMDEWTGPFYLRLQVADEPLVTARLTETLGEHGVSIDIMRQQHHEPKECASMVLTTHPVGERTMRAALASLASHSAVVEPPCLLRIESV